MKAINIKWDLTDDIFDYNVDDCDIPTIVDLPKDLDVSSVADYLSDTYGFCVISFGVVKDFEDLNEDELWEIRKQVVPNSLYDYDYFTKECYHPRDLSCFFDGYIDYLHEVAEDNGGKWSDYDDKVHLYDWFNCYDDLSWVRMENE